jgi:hypothetical protein
MWRGLLVAPIEFRDANPVLPFFDSDATVHQDFGGCKQYPTWIPV